MTFKTTFKSAVPPWECDNVDHFTVAFYYAKLEQATAAVLLDAGLDPCDPATPAMTGCHTQFSAELRKGDIYRIESERIGPDKLGHRLINAATKTTCTHFEQTLSGVLPDTLPIDPSQWDGPQIALVDPVADGPHWLGTGRDIVTDKDLTLAGTFSASAAIMLFSAAGEHLRSRIGMTPTYIRDANVGFSTFNFQAAFAGTARRGSALFTESCVAHIGRSSLRIVHRLRRAADGVEISRLTQSGVQLDLAARRPRRFPDEIADTARALLPA